MLKIFKDHSSRTCILDDFSFYEGRQNTIQEKKAKQQQYQKQARHMNACFYFVCCLLSLSINIICFCVVLEYETS